MCIRDRYVALRYGLADDYDRLDRLNRSGPEPAYDEGVILESRLCRNADVYKRQVYGHIRCVAGHFQCGLCIDPHCR